jgi:hypothetical protein
MKLRRLMQIARRGQSLPKRSVVRHSKIGPRMTATSHSRQRRSGRLVRLFPQLLQEQTLSRRGGRHGDSGKPTRV